ncbi:hypothetical protein DFH07DRAFT_946604 [Mycena maculata]|uniref:F-box domain-containing protein n=1 Tax=Mycena maculata TaxID=230809 RepID=A0AAD7HKY0_9AGAR|nr:hypothetical protein DFH07DRAFT_946604 [Mycena maculata]
MHPTLTIPEILDHIFVELNGAPLTQIDGPERDPRNLKDFAALARTCKGFKDIALDFLWSEQPTLTNILKCLPSHLWEQTGSQLRIIGKIEPADWESPLTYARRIRSSKLGWNLGDAFPGVDILEAINLIRLGRVERGVGSGLPLPIHSSLSRPQDYSRAISLPVSDSAMSLLPGLLPYPDLKSLTIIDETEDNSLFCGVVSKIAMTLRQIERLAVNKLDRAALEHLSHLPALKSLDLTQPDLRDLGSASLLPVAIRHQSFPSLHTLDLSHADLHFAFAIEFLTTLSNCRLRIFIVASDISMMNSTTSELYIALANHIAHPTLQTLFIEPTDAGEVPAPSAGMIGNYVITRNQLATLFCFRNLTVVRLNPPVGFDMDDAAAWDIARARPNLRNLQLSAASDLHQPSNISLHGLRAFAKHCKNLNYLCIPFDASVVPPFDNSPETRISQDRLESLEVQRSGIYHPPTVARFMSGLFPNLRDVVTYQAWLWADPLLVPAVEEDDETAVDHARHNLWKQVEALVPIITAVRREEQYWARSAPTAAM